MLYFEFTHTHFIFIRTLLQIFQEINYQLPQEKDKTKSFKNLSGLAAVTFSEYTISIFSIYLKVINTISEQLPRSLQPIYEDKNIR